MRIQRLVALAILVATAPGCAAAINYALSSVPEEGATRFTRITSESDEVLFPEVIRHKEYGLRYYVHQPFDVSPDGRHIVYLGKKNETINAFLRSTAGGAATTQRTFREEMHDVAFSPDGERIAFSDKRNQRWNVYEIGATSGSAIKQLTNFEQVSRYPAYNPRQNALMYVQYETSTVPARGGGREAATTGFAAVTRYYVWSLDLGSGSHTQYAEGFAPAVSPDGKLLALTRNSRDHGNSEIWLIDLQTGTETLVAGSKEQGYIQPSFSPDGETLVFTGVTKQERSRPTNLDIFTISVDGTNLIQHTFHPGNDLMGKFSPEGRSIYFLSQRGSDKGKYNIWRMDIAR